MMRSGSAVQRKGLAAVAGFIRLAADIVIAEMIRDATDTGQLSYADLYYAVTLLGGVATAINKMETRNSWRFGSLLPRQEVCLTNLGENTRLDSARALRRRRRSYGGNYPFALKLAPRLVIFGISPFSVSAVDFPKPGTD